MQGLIRTTAATATLTAFHPYPDRKRDDPTDRGYRPGSRPLPKTHLI